MKLLDRLSLSLPLRDAAPWGRAVQALLAACGVAWPIAGHVGPAKADLTICSRKNNRHIDVAIGYRKGDQWVSEGWWKLPPSDCITPVSGDLPVRYYYIRAVEWTTQKAWRDNYVFCTTSEPFTIYGDEQCEERGYKQEGFVQYDCGGSNYCYVTIWPEKISFAPPLVDQIVGRHLMRPLPAQPG